MEIPAPPTARPNLPIATLTGARRTYSDCQHEAQRLRDSGEPGLLAPSAALRLGAARGQLVDRGLQPGPPRDGQVAVLFGPRPDLVGWLAAGEARPPDALLSKVSRF